MSDKVWAGHNTACKCPPCSGHRSFVLWMTTLMWQSWHVGLFDVVLQFNGETIPVPRPARKDTRP